MGKKKKPKTSLDERIERVRKERKKKQGEKPDDQATATVEVKEEEEEASDDEDENDVEDELSDDELVHDNINVKKKKKKGISDEKSGKDAIVNITEEDNLPEDYDEEDEIRQTFSKCRTPLTRTPLFRQ